MLRALAIAGFLISDIGSDSIGLLNSSRPGHEANEPAPVFIDEADMPSQELTAAPSCCHTFCW